MGRGDMGCAVGAQSSRTLLGNGRARARRPAPACVRATEGRGTPMSGAGLALRRALVAALRADVELAGQLSGVFDAPLPRSEEHTSELQSLMRISYAVFCLKKKIYLHSLTLTCSLVSA